MLQATIYFEYVRHDNNSNGGIVKQGIKKFKDWSKIESYFDSLNVGEFIEGTDGVWYSNWIEKETDGITFRMRIYIELI